MARDDDPSGPSRLEFDPLSARWRPRRELAIAHRPEASERRGSVATDDRPGLVSHWPSASKAPAPPRHPAPYDDRSAVRVIAVAVAVGVAVVTAVQMASGGSRASTLIPLAAVGAVTLGVLALIRFETFVLATLVVRVVLDYTRSEPKSESTTHSGAAAGALAVLVIVAGLLWLAARRNTRRDNQRAPMELPLVLFFGAGLLSVLGSARPGTSSLEAGRIAAVVVMFVVIERMLVNRARIRRVLAAVFASALIPLAVAGYQATFGHGLLHTHGFGRIRGTFLHPNPFAAYLTFLVVMGVALYPHVKPRTRLPFALLLSACLAALLLTYTRSAWVAAFVGVVVVGVLQKRRFVAAALVVVALAAIAVPALSGRFSDLSQRRSSTGKAANSLVWRLDYWKEALHLAAKNPATGIGLKMTETTTLQGKQTHNDYLRAYVETGLVGLAAYLLFLGGMVVTARRALARRPKPGFDRGVAAGFAGCLAAYLLLSLVGNLFSQVVVIWYFLAFAAAAWVVSGLPEGQESWARTQLQLA